MTARDPEAAGGPAPLSSHEQRDQAHFDAIAERYAAKDLLPGHRRARVQRLLQTVALAPLQSDVSMLEVGCGAGFAALYLQGRYQRYLGIDHSAELVRLAERLNSGPRVSFQAVGLDDLETEERFQLILLIGVLHHMDQLPEKMKRLVELLQPGGWLVANEPQPANPLVRAARAFRKRLDRAYAEDQRELSRGELARLFTAAGLEQVSLRPQGLFSTPFAEVAMPFQLAVRPLSALACAVDRFLERYCAGALFGLSWNLAAAGRKPYSPAAAARDGREFHRR